MISVFKRRKERPTLFYPGFRWLGLTIDKQLHKGADYLNNKTGKTTRRSILVSLLLFCLLFGGSSIYLMVRAINNKTGNIKIEKISFPAYAISNDTNLYFNPLPVRATKEYQNIQRFTKTMDSLQSTASGKMIYDSICKARPGLMDSVSITEQIFLQQLKTN